MCWVERWIRPWLELVSARLARVGCEAVPVQRQVLALVLMWVPELVRVARPLLGLLRPGLLLSVVE